MDAYTLSVCADCLMYIANGETPHDPTQAVLTVRGVARECCDGGTLHAGGGQDADFGFSWHPCECCRSPLGGERYEAVLLSR